MSTIQRPNDYSSGRVADVPKGKAAEVQQVKAERANMEANQVVADAAADVNAAAGPKMAKEEAAILRGMVDTNSVSSTQAEKREALENARTEQRVADGKALNEKTAAQEKAHAERLAKSRVERGDKEGDKLKKIAGNNHFEEGKSKVAPEAQGQRIRVRHRPLSSRMSRHAHAGHGGTRAGHTGHASGSVPTVRTAPKALPSNAAQASVSLVHPGLKPAVQKSTSLGKNGTYVPVDGKAKTASGERGFRCFLAEPGGDGEKTEKYMKMLARNAELGQLFQARPAEAHTAAAGFITLAKAWTLDAKKYQKERGRGGEQSGSSSGRVSSGRRNQQDLEQQIALRSRLNPVV